MKNKTQIFNILVVVLLLAQLALWFVPFFTYDGEDFSLFEYCWTRTLDMRKIFRKLDTGLWKPNVIKAELGGYWANDYLSLLVLTQVFGVFALVLNVFKGNTLASHIVTVIWGVVGVVNFLTNAILTITGTNSTLYMVHLILSIVSLVVVLVRIWPWYVEFWSKMKKKSLF